LPLSITCGRGSAPAGGVLWMVGAVLTGFRFRL